MIRAVATGTVVVSTVYLDLIEEGWDCGAADAGACTHCMLAAPDHAPVFLYFWGGPNQAQTVLREHGRCLCFVARAATKAAACTAEGGTLGALFGTQCLCTVHRTSYPVGVEDMTVAFDHTVRYQYNPYRP